jgi:predicted branched-subunit amino acid permease
VEGGSPTPADEASPYAARLAAAWQGARETPFLPAFILFGTFVGFGALSSETGLTWLDTVFMSVFVFALPAQVALVDQMVRLLPMTVALLPMVRDRTVPKWMEFAVAYFVAVTMWVEAMRRVPGVPRPSRAAYVLGITAWLVVFSTAGGLLGFFLAARVPPVVAAALLFMTPSYFLLSMLASARSAAGVTPVVLGLVLGPLFHVVLPEFDLFLTGLIGGSVSVLLARALFKEGGGP